RYRVQSAMANANDGGTHAAGYADGLSSRRNPWLLRGGGHRRQACHGDSLLDATSGPQALMPFANATGGDRISYCNKPAVTALRALADRLHASSSRFHRIPLATAARRVLWFTSAAASARE